MAAKKPYYRLISEFSDGTTAGEEKIYDLTQIDGSWRLTRKDFTKAMATLGFLFGIGTALSACGPSKKELQRQKEIEELRRIQQRREERERQDREKAEREKAEREQRKREEAERAARQRVEQERQAREKAERERQEREQKEREKAEREQRDREEKERAERETAEKERKEREGKEIKVQIKNEITGVVETKTLPCGSPIPPGAICTCNCIPVASTPVPRSYRYCRCVPVCTCNKICTCIPVV